MPTVIENIFIPSSALGVNLYNAIFNALKAKEGTCSTDKGCILSISFNRIIEAYASLTNKFVVEYTYESFMPLVGVSYSSIVVAVYPEGSIINVNWCKHVTALILNKQFAVGTVVNVKLQEIKFNKNEFQCVAQCIDDC